MSVMASITPEVVEGDWSKFGRMKGRRCGEGWTDSSGRSPEAYARCRDGRLPSQVSRIRQGDASGPVVFATECRKFIPSNHNSETLADSACGKT